MNKKGVIGLVIAVIIIIMALVGYAIYRNNTTEENNTNLGNTQNVGNKTKELGTNSNNSNAVENENSDKENTINNKVSNEVETEKPNNEEKTLVVYYSAQTHTKAVAEKIARNLDADIFEIVPEQVYTSADLNWTDDNSRVSREHNDESLRNVKLASTKVEKWDEYDTILIGYPIWWGIAAWPVDTFVKANDFSGKTVIPFCTSSSSGLGQSGRLLKEEANSGNWLDGHRFNSNPSDSDIKNWTDSLK